MEVGSDAIVSMRGVTKSYDGKNLVVRHLDLDVERGEEARVSLDGGGEVVGRVADAGRLSSMVSLRPERARILGPDERADNG